MLHVAEGSGVVPALGQTGLERTPHILALMMSPPGPRQALEGGRAGGMGPNEGGGAVPLARPLTTQLTHLLDAVLNLGPKGIFRAVVKSSVWEPHRWK